MAKRCNNSGQVPAQVSSQQESLAELQILESIPPELMQMIFGFVDSKTLLVSVPAVCKQWRYHCRYTRVSVWVGFDGRWGRGAYIWMMGFRRGLLSSRVLAMEY